ncbi:MAG: hypothetical protein HQK77_14250 [Desulfobacterales bacterium]|nr:hypothetical protein [Desulfobacterales bacterium]
MDEHFKILKDAFLKMREASFQSHTGHWDKEGTGGINCPECIRASELRKEADEKWSIGERLFMI